MTNTKEVLNPQLKKFIKTINGLPFFYHPLFVSYYVGSADEADFFNHMINKKIALLSDLKEKYFNEDKLGRYVFLHDRPFRLQAFIDVIYSVLVLDVNEQWKLFDELWIDCESPYINMGAWLSILGMIGTSPSLQSDHFKQLNDEITIYRGGAHNGISWTGSKEVAEKFASRKYVDDLPVVITEITIPKNKVIHYTNERSEDEFMLDPADTAELFKNGIKH